MKNIYEEKKIFLEKLKSKNGKYKRYNGSPLRYGGGKSLAVGNIIELLPDNIERVVSPFLGGASVEIAISKELGVPVIGYDIFNLLVNYWNYQINKSDILVTGLEKLKPNKEEYEKVKNELKKTWNYKQGENDYLNNQDKAIYYYFNHNLSYGPGFLGWMSSIYQDEKKYFKLIDKVKKFSVNNFDVKCANFEYILPQHINDFLYLDPPYYLEGDSKMFKGIYPMRNFPIHHNLFNHENLAKLLHEHKGGFILSYNDCSWVREAYKNFKIIEVSWQYTMGQGETRIGKNRLDRDFDNGNIKKSHELLIIG